MTKTALQRGRRMVFSNISAQLIGCPYMEKITVDLYAIPCEKENQIRWIVALNVKGKSF